MDQFKFDAPRHFNFFRTERIHSRIEIDLNDNNDL